MPDSRVDLLEQIRKLRRLATSPVPAEASAALRKARELIKRYGVSAAELEPRVKKPPAPKSQTPATITLKIGNVRIRWKI